MQGRVSLSNSFKHKQRLARSLSACRDRACKIAIIIQEENKNKTMNRHTLVFERMITVPSGMLKGALGQVNSSERQQDLHRAKCDFLQTTNTRALFKHGADVYLNVHTVQCIRKAYTLCVLATVHWQHKKAFFLPYLCIKQ